MNQYVAQYSTVARKAVSRKDWATVNGCANEIIKLDSKSAEGYFLSGLVAKASGKLGKTTEAFAKALELDADRYDAAIELANQHCIARHNADAYALVIKYEDKLSNSPVYLSLAGSVYADIGMSDRAWPLYNKANELQPDIDLFQANIATCAVFLGKIEKAKVIYKRLLDRHPTHQHYHYQLARAERATDTTHVEQMKEVLRSMNLPPDKNIFLYYAIGKELEDLEQWEEAFKYFKMAGDAVASVADYVINTDLQLIDKIIEVCNEGWLRDGAIKATSSTLEKTPIFVVGLPRTGSTLIERIIASHSKVRSVNETQFLQTVIHRESGVISDEKMTAEMIEVAAKLDIKIIGDGYMELINYKLRDEPMFVDKLPFNVFYLGFITKAFPNARIVHVKRNPMDSCFAMYKQVFTWAYKFSYTLDGLGRFYPAFTRLLDHWHETLGGRFIEVEYEKLIADQENQTRVLLEKLGLDFEEACLNFEQNTAAAVTASAVQVREKIHSRSVDRWKNYERQLQPLKECLENAGITVN